MIVRQKNGFTLIEVLIAGVIFAQVALVGAAAMSSIFKVEKQTSILRARQQTVRSILESVSRDVRWAYSITIVDSDTLKIIPTMPDGKPGVEKTIERRSDSNLYSGSEKLNSDDVLIDTFEVSGISANNPFVFIKLIAKSKLDQDQTLEASTIAVPRQYTNE